MVQLRTEAALVVWFGFIAVVDCFTPELLVFSASSKTTTHHSKLHAISPTRNDVVTFRYSTISLDHLKNVELPRDYSRPWTMEKTKAAVGALALGAILALGSNVILQTVLKENNTEDTERISLLLFAAGIVAGWNFFGGQEITASEMPLNGGLDAKLVADRPARLKATIDFLEQQPDVVLQETVPTNENKCLPYINRVHDEAYVEELKTMSLESDRPRRLNPLYARTLIDQYSYDAAVHAVGAWMDAVDSAILGETPSFCLVRPPSHHACRGKGMGGCLLNSIAIAAVYALDQPGIQNVAILDMDAHHGNGIAHCVQDEPRVRYCSIHEDVQQPIFTDKDKLLYDPRSPSSDDHGPRGNILNINLPGGTTWENGYEEALENKALPFVCENQPDLLLVAAGFDALDDDWSSNLNLQTVDYAKLGAALKQKFGNRVAFGLEGGYAYTNGKLGESVYEFVKPWNKL